MQSSQPCRYYAKGNCRFSDAECRYSHTSREMTPHHNQAPFRQHNQTSNHHNNQSLVLKQNHSLQKQVDSLKQQIDKQEKNELRRCIAEQKNQIESLAKVSYDTQQKHDQDMKDITEKLYNHSLQTVASQSAIAAEVKSGIRGFKALQEQVVSIQNKPKSPAKETHTVQVVGAPLDLYRCTHSTSFFCSTRCRWLYI